MIKWMLVMSLMFCATLSAEIKVLAFAGSLREDSVNKKLVAEAASIAKELGANVTLVNLKDYQAPFYDEDLETKEGLPSKAKALRDLMIKSQVIFIASPEYNSSVSAALKNAIDWSSRNEQGQGSRDAFKGKKFLIMGASPGGSGAARGLVHLRAILENVGATVIPQQITVPNAYDAFDQQGHLKDPKLQADLRSAVQAALK